MKKLFVGLVVLALSVAGILGADLSRRSIAEAEQKFSSLPIGYNLEGYISRIQLDIWSRVSGNGLNEPVEYRSKRDGVLEAFASRKLRELAERFSPLTGSEGDTYGWGIVAITDGIGGLLPTYYGESKPAAIAIAPPAGTSFDFRLTLRNGKWEVPEEVFGKVRFQWPAAVGYTIPAWNLKVDVSDSKGKIARFAARERIQEEGNPCALPVILMGLNTGGVLIPEEIATAQPAWWERAEITLETEDGASVTFLVNRTERDGTAIRWSTPAPSFFAPPTPKIASLKRVGGATEIVVERSGAVSLEFSENLRDWREVDGSRIALASENTSVVVRHTSAAPSGFYRLRLIEDGAQ